MKTHSERIRREEEQFRKAFFKGLLMSLGAAVLIGGTLFAMGLIAFLGAKYGW
jgi:hypothetical protein